MPAALLSSTPDRWLIVPAPDEAYCTPSGCDFASAISSADIVRRQRRMRHQHLRRVGDERDRREVLAEIEAQIVHRRIDGLGDGAHQQRVAILRRARDIFRAEARARAGPVLHHQLLAEALAHAGRHDPQDDVGDRAGTEADHDADRPGG